MAKAAISLARSPAFDAQAECGYLTKTVMAWLYAPPPLRLPFLPRSPNMRLLMRSSSLLGFLDSSSASFQSISARR